MKFHFHGLQYNQSLILLDPISRIDLYFPDTARHWCKFYPDIFVSLNVQITCIKSGFGGSYEPGLIKKPENSVGQVFNSVDIMIFDT